MRKSGKLCNCTPEEQKAILEEAKAIAAKIDREVFKQIMEENTPGYWSIAEEEEPKRIDAREAPKSWLNDTKNVKNG